MLDEIRPIEQWQAACIPFDWLLTALISICEGSLQVSESERKVISLAVHDRIAQEEARLPAGFDSAVGARLSSCLVSSSAAEGATLEEYAQRWGWWLVALHGDRGNFDQADERLVQELREWMAHWHLHDEGWWNGLWSGLGQGTGTRAISMQLAIFEALFEILPKDAWVDRLSRLSALGHRDSPLAGLSAWSMGACLGRRLEAEDYFALLSLQAGASWSRAVVMGFPNASKWPARGHAAVPAEVIRALVGLRELESYEHRGELLLGQWNLLGPEEATRDLERFSSQPHGSSADWDWEAALRVSAALGAIRDAIAGRVESDVPSTAREVLGRFFAECSTEDAARVLEALRRRLWTGAQTHGNVERRRLLAEVIGASGAHVSNELRAWLEAP